LVLVLAESLEEMEGKLAEQLTNSGTFEKCALGWCVCVRACVYTLFHVNTSKLDLLWLAHVLVLSCA